MSAFTLGEIVVWLVLAAALGFVLGWLVRSLTFRARRDAPPPVIASIDVHVVEEPAADEPAADDSAADGPATGVVRDDEQAYEPGRHPRSARPLAGGAAPTPEFVVKGNEKSMIYHPPGSPSYDRTTAQTWFRSEADAVAAGFRKPKNA